MPGKRKIIHERGRIPIQPAFDIPALPDPSYVFLIELQNLDQYLGV